MTDVPLSTRTEPAGMTRRDPCIGKKHNYKGEPMLKLTQRPGESVIITLPDGQLIKVTCWAVRGNQVVIAYDASRSIVIDREPIWLRKQREGGKPDGTA